MEKKWRLLGTFTLWAKEEQSFLCFVPLMLCKRKGWENYSYTAENEDFVNGYLAAYTQQKWLNQVGSLDFGGSVPPLCSSLFWAIIAHVISPLIRLSRSNLLF